MHTNGAAIISDVLVRNPKRVEPIMVEFQHGVLRPDAVDAVEGAVFAKKRHSFGTTSAGTTELVTCCKVDGMMYKGYPQTSTENKSFIALRNKLTNKVQLIEISSVSLRPVVMPAVSTNPLLMKEKDAEEDKASRQNKSRSLVHNFGGLKGQRLYDQAERLGVKAETVKVNLEEAVKKTNIEESAITPRKEESFDYLLPPCNRNATQPVDVYKESDLITETDLQALENVASVCMASDEATVAEWKNSKIYSSYFTSSLQDVKAKFTGDQLKHKIKLLVYTECLIKFCNLKAFAVRRKDPLPEDFPLEIRQKVLTTFAPRKEGSSDRQFTKVDRERCICYVIILGLLIGDFALDLKLLSESLHTGTDKLVPLVRVVGAQNVVEKLNGKHFAMLDIPLAEVPKQGGIRRKRGAK